MRGPYDISIARIRGERLRDAVDNAVHWMKKIMERHLHGHRRNPHDLSKPSSSAKDLLPAPMKVRAGSVIFHFISLGPDMRQGSGLELRCAPGDAIGVHLTTSLTQEKGVVPETHPLRSRMMGMRAWL